MLVFAGIRGKGTMGAVGPPTMQTNIDCSIFRALNCWFMNNLNEIL